MSKVVLLVDDFGTEKSRAIAEIRATVTISLAEITTAAQRGTPVLERTLFDRGDREFPQRLLRMLETLRKIGASCRVYELLEGQTFDPAKCSGYFEVTADRLEKMISTRTTSLDRQRKLGRIEEGGQETGQV